MKLTRIFVSLAISLSLVFISLPYLPIQQIATAQQDTRVALQRGYRTGYSDGYMAGYRDVIENAKRNFERHSEYVKADRAYSKEYGALEDYSDGYRQGFENGYNSGFDKRSFDASLPTELKRRGNAQINTTSETTETDETVNQPTDADTTTEQNREVSVIAPTDDRSVIIPVETELIVELVESIDTEQNKTGDKFQARVVSPSEISGALVEGRIAKIQKPGRIKRRAEMQLSFDRINLTDNRWGNYNAILTEVLPLKGDGVKRVDVEGTVEGKRNYKKDAAKVGASTGGGAVVGGLIGGPVGVAVGAGVGAAFGVGTVVVERGRHIKLIRGQQLRLKTAYETQIR
ncbi:MAG TPA: hypothetical protein VF721_08085 [Pyrinomonadaceae bacterium]|jgi:hypothetical protein